MRNKFFSRMLILFSAFLTIKTTTHVVTTFAPDFSVFYQSAQNLIKGNNIYTDSTLYTGLGYPPFTIVWFLPFVLLPYQSAQTIWIILTVLVAVACVYLSVRLSMKKPSLLDYIAVYAVFILSFPTRFTIGMGQINILALLLFLFFAKFVIEKRELLGGLFLGLLWSLKPHFILVLPIYLLLHLWKSVTLALGVVILLLFAFGYMFGWTQFLTYMTHTLPPLLPFIGRDIYYNQSLSGMFSRVFPYPYSYGTTMVLSAFLYITSAWVIFRMGNPIKSALVLSLPLFLLIEPLAWQHHFVFLLPSIVWMWERVKKRQDNVLRLVILASIGLVSLNIKNPTTLKAFWFGSLLLSHATIGTISLFFVSVYTMVKQRKERNI